MRPAEYAQTLLRQLDRPTRKRARSQAADTIGRDVQRQLLQRLCELDPESFDLDVTLAKIVAEHRPADGPIRALARLFRDEFRTSGAIGERASGGTTERS